MRIDHPGILSLERQGNDIRLTWTTVGGQSYRVQSSSDLNTTFTDSSPLVPAPGPGTSTTNHLDVSASTSAARYYRVRLEP